MSCLTIVTTLIIKQLICKNNTFTTPPIFSTFSTLLHLYNNIITGNTPHNNQIIVERGEITTGTNLIEGENGVTRNLVFGNNQFQPILNCIFPLEYSLNAYMLLKSVFFFFCNSFCIKLNTFEVVPIVGT